MFKKHIMLAVVLTAGVSLSGCQILTESTGLAANTILTSLEVDAMQTELGAYVDNQTALDEIDNIQSDVLHTLTTGEGAENILSYQARSLIAYKTMRDNALDKWDLLSTDQQTNLINLDNSLIALNDEFNDVLNSTGFTTEVLDILYRAAILMSYYKAI